MFANPVTEPFLSETVYLHRHGDRVVKNHPPLQHVEDNARTEATTVLELKTTQNKTKNRRKN
jgi:hypothetical protein